MKRRMGQCGQFTCMQRTVLQSGRMSSGLAGAGCAVSARTRREKCVAIRHCRWHAQEEGGSSTGQGRCEDVFEGAVMASKYDDELYEPTPIEDDLAALFFLYPTRARGPSWGVAPLELKLLPLVKLRHIAARLGLDVDMSDGATKMSVLRAIKDHRVARAVAKQQLLKPTTHLQALGNETRRLVEALRSIRAKSDATTQGELEQARTAFEAARAAAEREGTDDEDGAKPVGNVGDTDGDGVEDKDSDGDEIPDEVEAGLDALLEAAACESDPAACEAGHEHDAGSGTAGSFDASHEEFGSDNVEEEAGIRGKEEL